MCVNAANVDKDFAHMRANSRGAEITNESAEWSQIAVQGPKALETLQPLTNVSLARSSTITSPWAA